MKKIIIWYNPNKDTFYYKIVRGIYYESYNYEIGSVNSYGHIIKFIIPLNDVIDFKQRTIKQQFYFRLYSFLKKKI